MANVISISKNKLARLEKIASGIREDIINMLVEAGSGHPASSLGMTDIFTAMYFHILDHDPKRPNWKNRSRLILSSGHVCPAQYATMARAGYFPKKLLMSLRKFGSPLQGHPERWSPPGIETTSGPLGSGSSQAAGLAYAALMDNAAWRVYCLMSDAELECGQTWEAFLFAARNKLSNCTFVIDRNSIQIDGTTEDIMPLEPIAAKLKAFNLNVERCVGNSIKDFIAAIGRARYVTDKPTAIIADTIPGFGVKFMEGDYKWHGKTLSPGKEACEAIKNIRAGKNNQ